MILAVFCGEVREVKSLPLKSSSFGSMNRLSASSSILELMESWDIGFLLRFLLTRESLAPYKSLSVISTFVSKTFASEFV